MVMGVVNVTPDSFSDGGRHADPESAVAHGLALVAAGADIIDVGGESTRPGATPVDAAEEVARVLPVVERLVSATDVAISVDTTKAAVADAALGAGARIVNDVSAGTVDDEMLPTVAGHGAAYVAMHMLGTPRTMQEDPRYDDVVAEVTEYLAERLVAAREAGIEPGALAADPGIGFGKTVEHNLELLAGAGALRRALGVPLVVGTSRKRFIGEVLRRATGGEYGPDEREHGTLATVAWLAEAGVDIVRVHDVARAARVVAVSGGVAA